MTKKVMELIDVQTGLMECRICGRCHWAMLKAGQYKRGSWQCLNGCTLDDATEEE